MSGGLISFILQAVVVSLSGAIAPGPVTAATLAAGTRSRHAGGLVGIGHMIVEAPVLLLIAAGMSRLLIGKPVAIGIGLLGGTLLIVMAMQLLRSIGQPDDCGGAPKPGSPILTGIVLTAGNPYFLLWWVTVGLAFATRAVELGALALVTFAIVHWLCDVVWLEILSFTSFKGTRLFGHRTQRIVLALCSFSMLAIGLAFLIDAGRKWIQ
jgi:threonine/homoserine/homoserine lactone efflux protein